MRNKGPWALMTLLAAITLGWAGALCWKVSQPKRRAEPAPAAETLEWTSFEKEVLFRLDSLRAKPSPATSAFLGELDADAPLRPALARGPSTDEVRRFKALVAKYAGQPGFSRAVSVPEAPATGASASCGPMKETSKPKSPLETPSPDSSCSKSSPELPIAGSH